MELNEEPDEKEDFFEESDEWHCTIKMGIEETRLLYNVMTGYLELWPGSPRRPAVEQQYLQFMKSKMYGMLMDYNFHHK